MKKENKLSVFFKKVKSWLLHNSVLKILSFLIAFGIWVAVVNYTNPEIQASVKAGLEVRNSNELDLADKVSSYDVKNVTITYKIRSANRALVEPSDFKAYIDFADYSITGAVPVYVDVDDRISQYVSDVQFNPIVVHVTTENIVRKKFEIQGRVNGKAADGYVLGELSYDPEYIYISGPLSEVSKISSVGFEVTADNPNTDISGSERVKLYNSSGKQITCDVKLSTDGFVSYTLKVYKTKSITVKVAAGGNPAVGYVLDNIETSPTFLSVYGDNEALDDLAYILIPRTDINIDGASENLTFNLDVNHYLPDGIFLNQGNSQLVVLVKIRSIKEVAEAARSLTASSVTENMSESLPEQTGSAEEISLPVQEGTTEETEGSVSHESEQETEENTENESESESYGSEETSEDLTKEHETTHVD